MQRKLTLIVCLGLLMTASLARAADSDAKAARELYERVTPSLVVVQYTFDGEPGRREIAGAGVVVGDDGLVMLSLTLVPPGLPDEQMKDFKVIIPGDEETELDATFEGRDERTSLAFVKVKDASKQKWTPIKFEDAPAKVGDSIMSIGLLSKGAGYRAFLVKSTVSAQLRGPIPQVLVSEGLAATGSPVFNADGKAIGLVQSSLGQNPMLNADTRIGLEAVLNPPHTYIPASDFLQSLSDPPKGKPLVMPWIGVTQLTGLNKEVAEYYGLKNQPAVQVGDVIPNTPAAKSGIKSGDVIVKYNGAVLERGDSPEETWRILMRKISRLKIGESVTLSILTSKDTPAKDVKVDLVERPAPASRAKRFYAEDLGFSVRDVVFEDTYERKLPADAGGVVVAFVKPGSSAATARLAPAHTTQEGRESADLITQFNGKAVKDVEDFKTRYQAFRKEKPTEAVVLEVMRGASTQVIRIEPPQEQADKMRGNVALA